MTELFEKSIRVLELPQLLERLSQKAVSEAAKERALRLTPFTDADDVRRLQDETDAARALIGLRGSPSFSGVKDVREALARAERGGMLNPRELLTIAGLLTNSRRVREYYEADQGEGSVLDRMFDSLHANRFLEEKITTSILSEDEIADAASPELADIRSHKRAASAKGRQILQKIISSPSYKSTLQEALITQRDGRFVVPVKADHRGDLPGLVHDISASGATLFVEPMGVVQANNELKELEAKEKKEIERILLALSAEAAGFAEAILWDYDILVHLDLIFARGEAEAKRILADAKSTADAAFRELDELRKAQKKQLDAQAMNEKRVEIVSELNAARERAGVRDESREPIPAPSRPIRAGDLVEIPGTNRPAEVTAVKGDRLVLKAGVLSMTVKNDEVRLIEDDERAAMKKKTAPASPSRRILNTAAAARELDLRGMETLEAESVLENYLDAARRAHLETVTIIHGKGTGALRKAVQAALRRDKTVKSFRLGNYGEGESGVTVVEFK